MTLCGIIFTIMYVTKSSSSVGIEIEGLIDLGPKWSYEYKVSPIKQLELASNASNNVSHIANVRKGNDENDDVIKIKYDEIDLNLIEKTTFSLQNQKKITNNKQKLVHNDDVSNIFTNTANYKHFTNSNRGRSTLIYSDYEINDKYLRKNEKQINPKFKTLADIQKTNVNDKKKVKDDMKIHNFNEHISKQSLKVFENWKKNTDSLKTKTKIDMLQNNFIDKFSSFLKQNENYILRTKLAPQKVVVNLMDTAYKMMQRCINYLANDEDVRRNLNIQLLYKELNRQNEIENLHACKILGACRTNEEYTEFIINIVTLILQSSDSKVQQATNAITEVVKSNDFTDIIDVEAENYINKSINSMEFLGPFSTRAMLLIFRNVLLNRNKPVFVMNSVDRTVAQRTEALHNLMDVLNTHMNTNDNKKEWREIMTEIKNWKDDKIKHIQSSIERIFKQLKRELEKVGREVKRKVSEYLKIIHVKLQI